MEVKLRTEAARSVVAHVLNQIAERCPDDHARVLERILSIGPYTPKDDEDTTHGMFVVVYHDNQRYDGDAEYPYPPGYVELREDWPLFPFIVAHEFGHAVTTFKDMEQRCAPLAEWASEACADMYADRWGFEKPDLDFDFGHHGPRLGEWAEVDGVRFVLGPGYVFDAIVA